MRSSILTAAALALCISGALVACSPQDGSAPAVKTAPGQAAQATPAAQHADETRRVSIEEAQKAVEAGTAIFVDVRDEHSYQTSHIKGARNIPLKEVDKRAGELPADKLIITYCA